MEKFIATFAPNWQETFREDALAGRKRSIACKVLGEEWAMYELDPEHGVARVIRTGA